MDDWRAIYDVLVRYAAALDRRDFDAVGSCFADDARVSYAAGDAGPGREAVVDLLHRHLTSTASTHLVGGVSIEVAGDRATSDHTALAFHLEDGKVRFRGLRYADRLERRAGRWQIVERVHQSGWSAEADAVG